jgi:hypothetical protein
LPPWGEGFIPFPFILPIGFQNSSPPFEVKATIHLIGLSSRAKVSSKKIWMLI